MILQLKDDKERIVQLLKTVVADGAHYIYHASRKDGDYIVMVKTPVEHIKIHVPSQLLEQDSLTLQDRDYIFRQIFSLELLNRIRNADPAEINIPEIRHKNGLNWRRFLNWFGFD